MARRRSLWLMVLVLEWGCSSGAEQTPNGGAVDDPWAVEGPAWTPGTVYPSPDRTTVRGYRDLRGLIHEHSIYSHDACDNAPRDASGNYDQTCFDDFRRGLCQTPHDFVMLSDHPDSFSEHEFPDVLLYRSERGDELVERDGAPIANWAGCDTGHRTLLIAGCEAGNQMPIGLEHQIGATADARSTVYGSAADADIAATKDAGALAFVSHTENYTADQVVAMPLDGFEMYNLHANFTAEISKALSILPLLDQPDQLMAPDLVLIAMIAEDPSYLGTWGSVLARGVRRVTTMATDAHRNALPALMPDGERVDSWRRMNAFFSNHLLVRSQSDGSWDDRDLKDALRAERLYGVFEFLGYAADFDYRAETTGGVHDMGEQVSIAEGAKLIVTLPRVRHLDPTVEPPALRVRVLKAKEGGWDEIASGNSDLHVTPTEPGAYRAEVRMTPHHLREALHSFSNLADREFVWIYSNAIYVTP